MIITKVEEAQLVDYTYIYIHRKTTGVATAFGATTI